MGKVRPTTVVAEGLIMNFDHDPATHENMWKQTKDGHVYVRIGKGAAWRGVKVDNPQKLFLKQGVLCERKKYTDGYQYDAPVAFRMGEFRIVIRTDDAKPSIKERLGAFLRRKLTCTSRLDKK